MGLLSQRIERSCLKPGDHIYSWRNFGYAHHGIYMGNDKVCHVNRRGSESNSSIMGWFSAGYTYVQCRACIPNHMVSYTCLNCFLAGGTLRRFEYGVTPPRFLARLRGGTCTIARADPAEVVLRRAEHLVGGGFGCFGTFMNNCEDFAIYCKTGLIAGLSGMAMTCIGTILSSMQLLLVVIATDNYVAAVTAAVGVYFAALCVGDIGLRPDAERVAVEDLKRRYASETSVW